MQLELSFTINGQEKRLNVAANRTVADLLREDLNLTGCRVACDAEVCGSCTVLIDGRPAAACSTFAFEADGAFIETIEGLAENDVLHAIQQAFLETNAFQCGFCTSGFVMSVKALLKVDPSPTDDAIKEWLKSNICRCTGYQPILQATRLAAKRIGVPA
ncbi:(2Fe-2S)-binding protein [Bradyrhizobium sp. WSM1417]|uniref:(2Fe-2S)-binding protein n=1 Tax=Bradyrhizobium sp. WSM1417 TaxID=754500 RepID=UPI000484C836|nr:(2Fe-2S)-binding protein [Bradyrhizobium sp. WSM1417]